jgi:hypothetical protein
MNKIIPLISDLDGGRHGNAQEKLMMGDNERIQFTTTMLSIKIATTRELKEIEGLQRQFEQDQMFKVA